MATIGQKLSVPRVFISYSHDSVEHAAKVLSLADKLRHDGIDANIDQYEPAPPNGWPLWMEKQIKDSDFILLVCTPIYYRRIQKDCDPNVGQGACWEANLIYQILYEQKIMNERFLPLLLSGEDPTSIPLPLRGATRYDLMDQNGYAALYRTLTRQQDVAKPALGTLKPLTRRPRNIPPNAFLLANVKERLQPLRSEVVTLPTLSPNFPEPPCKELGRDHVIHTIQSLLGRDIDIVAIEGDEGIGKTMLLSQFARSLPMTAISIFIRSADRYSYEPESN